MGHEEQQAFASVQYSEQVETLRTVQTTVYGTFEVPG